MSSSQKKWHPPVGLTERSPESAPKCPQCGYSLFGLTELRCPECGFEIANDDDLATARWLADVNAPNRRALVWQWVEFAVGAVLTVAGVIVGGLTLNGNPRNWGFYFGACALTVLILAFTGSEYGPTHRKILGLGVLWMLILLLLLI